MSVMSDMCDRRLAEPRKRLETGAEEDAFWAGFNTALDLCRFEVVIKCVKCSSRISTRNPRCECCGSPKVREQLYAAGARSR